MAKTKKGIQNSDITFVLYILLRNSKTEYYSNLNVKNVSDNKTFWKILKPFLWDKVTYIQKITLINNDEFANNDYETEEF